MTLVLRTVRSLVIMVVVSTAALLAVDRLEPPGEDRGAHSAAVAITLIGAVGLAQVIGSIARRHPHSWQTAPPLWRRTGRRGVADQLPAVRELEALVISAATGGPRSRDRLDRRLDALGCGTLAGRLRSDAPSSDEIFDAVEQLLTEAETTDDR